MKSEDIMSNRLLMGNEAMAFGAIKAGVNVVSGYPGTPSTEVLETIAKNNPGDIYVEWSVNEKVAMEVAAGASYAGSRSLVTMKQVGLNVASDPLMSLSYIGVKGGMVVLVADDPGPFSSQTEQDTRHYAKFANLPVFDPSSPEEAYEMIQAAFELSEKVKKPVFLRPTTRVCHSCSTVNVSEERLIHKAEGFVKDINWVIFPALSYKKHVQIEKLQKEISIMFDDSEYNSVTILGDNKAVKKGIAASGVAYAYIKEVLSETKADVKLFKVGTPYPLPNKLALGFMEGLNEVLVMEELDPVIEEGLLEISGANKINTVIKGKKTGHMPFAGEYSYEIVKAAFLKFMGKEEDSASENPDSIKAPELPIRPPVLCAGCPHRASFYAVKKAMSGKKAVFTGDIGCYTLGNAKPLDMVDTCLCMGAGITIAQGLKHSENDVSHIAFIGDSTFFHTGIPGVINAVYNETDITVVILDNSTTAMTGHQPHPGTGKTMMNTVSEKVDIYNLVKACGVKFVEKADPLDFDKAVDIIKRAVDFKGTSVVIFQSPCIALFKPEKKYMINEKCISCKKCINEIGCPAITVSEKGKVIIEPSTCYGCGLCEKVCPVSAIGGVK